MVGFEGIFGLIAEAIIIVIMTFVPCSFGIDACVIDSAGLPYIERP
jgi:hypothetical protein